MRSWAAFKPETTFCLYGVAAAYAPHGRAVEGANLLGAAEAERASRGLAMDDPERRLHDHAVVAIRREIDDEEFEAALAAGRTLGIDAAFELALGREPGGVRGS